MKVLPVALRRLRYAIHLRHLSNRGLALVVNGLASDHHNLDAETDQEQRMRQRYVDKGASDPLVITSVVIEVGRRLAPLLEQILSDAVEPTKARIENRPVRAPKVNPSDWHLVNKANEMLDGLAEDVTEPTCIALLTHNNAVVRERTIRWLIKLRSPALPEILIPYLKDKSPRIRKVSIEGLVKAADSQAIRPLKELYEAERDPDLRVAIKEALFKLEKRGPREVIKYDNI